MCRGGIHILSAYMHDSQGLSKSNLDILHDLGHIVCTLVGPWVTGGDFNMDPSMLNEAGYPKRMGATLAVPHAPRGTCTSAEGGSTLDYFLIDNQLATGIADIRVN